MRVESVTNKLIVLLHGIFVRARKVYGLRLNPVAEVEKFPQQRSGDIEVYSPEEVWALVRAAASSQDAAIYLTAAFTGQRRGELIALRWRDVDFAGSAIRVRSSFAGGALTTPKSGKVRSVPMAPEVASALAKLADRSRWIGDDDLVFVGVLGSYLDGSALRRRYDVAVKAAWHTAAALPRPAPHLRHADDRQGGHPPRAGVDGPRRRADDDEVPP
jgi:integrase